MGKYTYRGTNQVDIVKQNGSNRDYYNIITKGAADQISLVLTDTWVNAGSGADDVKSNIEGGNRIDLGNGTDTYVGKGFAKNNRHDEVYGGAGDDTMTLFTRQSDYYGNGGNDYISSAGYWNFLAGGDGKDTVSYQAQDNDWYLKGWGVYVDIGREIAKTGEGRKEWVIDFENAEGTSFGDDVYGSNGDNKLWGMDGSDDVAGFKGDDQLFGGKGADYMSGGNGKDDLTGGKGVDRMWGDAAADTFIYNNVNQTGLGSKADVIKDFEDRDKIDLSAAGDFTFIGNSAFSDTAGELRFHNGVLSGDVDGDGKADFQIKVDHVNAMHNSDFIL